LKNEEKKECVENLTKTWWESGLRNVGQMLSPKYHAREREGVSRTSDFLAQGGIARGKRKPEALDKGE